VSPRDPRAELHLVESAVGRHLFVADGSRIYDLDDEDVLNLDALGPLLEELAPEATRRIRGDRVVPPPLQTLSLNVAQACNMGCGYCYADEGRFGGAARLMSIEVGKAAVERLLAESAAGAEIVVGFMGGEPFLNKPLLHALVPYAEDRAAAAGRRVRFSVTTNATLLDREDVRLLARHPFPVAVSLDGPRATNDRVRPLNGGGSSHDRVLNTLRLFAAEGRPRHLSARATVTPRSGPLVVTLEYLVGLGFDSVGFAAVLVSPDARIAFDKADFDGFLAEMIAAGEIAKRAILERRRFPFANFETALQELERGSHRPYPCGAGAAYLSVNAEGGMYACHRLVDDPRHALGTLAAGSDRARRVEHLVERHVDRQEPCRSCWARYLCGGGCYHEVDRRGRIACDYIRGWLSWCIAAYAELRTHAPDYFVSPETYFRPSGATTPASARGGEAGG
jgi:uncharacterized protein